jgi:predicted transcriptional regulator
MIMEQKRRIAVQDLRPPAKSDEGGDIEWLCRSLNLFTKNDTEKSAYKVFRIIVRSSIEGKPKTSTEIAEELSLARGTVLFHMKKFASSGLVEQASGRKYILRESCLEDTLDDMMRDMEKMFSRMKRVAAEIDKEMGFEKRW